MTVVSTPASKSAIAALCLSTCGEILFLASDGHCVEAAATYFARRYWTASLLIRAPWTVGNSAVLPRLAGSPSQVRKVVRAAWVNGVARSFRPLPRQRTFVPGPRCTASRSRPTRAAEDRGGGQFQQVIDSL